MLCKLPLGSVVTVVGLGSPSHCISTFLYQLYHILGMCVLCIILCVAIDLLVSHCVLQWCKV